MVIKFDIIEDSIEKIINSQLPTHQEELRANDGNLFKFLIVLFISLIAYLYIVPLNAATRVNYANIYFISILLGLPQMFSYFKKSNKSAVFCVYICALIWACWFLLFRHPIYYKPLVFEFAALLSVIIAALFYFIFYKKQFAYNKQILSRDIEQYNERVNEYDAIAAARAVLENKANLIISIFESAKDLQNCDDFDKFIERLKIIIAKHFDFKVARLIILKNAANQSRLNLTIKSSATAPKNQSIDIIQMQNTQNPEYDGFFYPSNSEAYSIESDYHLLKNKVNQELWSLLTQHLSTLIYDKTENKYFKLTPQNLTHSEDIFVPLVTFDILYGLLHIRKHNGFNKFEIDCLEILARRGSQIYRNIELFNNINELIVYDGLTKLFVHKYFKKKLEDEFDRAKITDAPFSLLLLDIDHFKIINDTYGHQAGDEVLKNAAVIFSHSIRTVDFAARYGGDEFAIILPHTDKSGATILATRIRERIKNSTVKFHDKELKITISIGVAAFDKAMNSPEKLMDCADKALYASKHKGRDCVTVA